MRVETRELWRAVVTTLGVGLEFSMLAADTVARREAEVDEVHVVLRGFGESEQQVGRFHVCVDVLLFVEILKRVNLERTIMVIK